MKLNQINKTLFTLILSLFALSSYSTPQENSSKVTKMANYITSKYKNVSSQDAIKISNTALIHAQKHNIEPSLILGLIEKESGFQKNIVSKGNAHGLMQIIPKWHKQNINEVIAQNGGTLKTIDNNVAIGTNILKTQLKKYPNVSRALQAYNGNHNGSSYARQVLHYQRQIKQSVGI